MTGEKLPRPEVIFFDLFGTIFKWSKSPRVAISEVLTAHDYHVPPDAVLKARREIERKLPARDEFPTDFEPQYWNHYNEELLGKLQVPPTPELLAAIEAEIKQNVDLGLQPDAMPALQALKRTGVSLGVISNATFGAKRDFMRLKLGPFFPQVVISQAVHARKPDPHIFLIALSKFGCAPPRAWMVGDEVDTDIRGARGVGMVPILVDREGTAPPDPRATVVRDLNEVVALYRDSEG